MSRRILNPFDKGHHGLTAIDGATLERRGCLDANDELNPGDAEGVEFELNEGGKTMNVSDIMHYEVRTALTSDSVSLAMHIMLGARVSGLPVVNEKGALVGILTEGDLLRRAETGTERQRPQWLGILLGPRHLAREYVETHSRRVADLMTPNVITVDESAPLSEAVALLEKHHVKRLPVLRGGQLIGILSRADLMRAFLGALPVPSESAHLSDTEIQHHIKQEMLRHPWIARAAVRVTVSRGAVDIDGVVTNGAMRDAIRVLVENTPGVSNVKDNLVITEPSSQI